MHCNIVVNPPQSDFVDGTIVSVSAEPAPGYQFGGWGGDLTGTNNPGNLLIDGNKVRVRVRFRGREITYPELALNDLKEVAETLSDVAIVEQAPVLEGRTMLMILGPGKMPKKK